MTSPLLKKLESGNFPNMWYGVSYSCDGFEHEDPKAIEQVALAAIMNFQDMKECYLGSSANDDYTRGHRYGTRFLGKTGRGYMFYVLEPQGDVYRHIATVVIDFEWVTEVGKDKFARTVGYNAHATIYPPNVGK